MKKKSKKTTRGPLTTKSGAAGNARYDRKNQTTRADMPRGEQESRGPLGRGSTPPPAPNPRASGSRSRGR